MWYIVAAVVIVAVVLMYWAWQRSRPSVEMFRTIEKTICQLQRLAVENVFQHQPDGQLSKAEEEAYKRQSAMIGEIISFVYSIEKCDDNVAHLISSRLHCEKSEKYHLQCMSVAILLIVHQLNACDISEKDVGFELKRSDQGTQYLGVMLTAEQHEKLVAYIEGSRGLHDD